MQLLMRVADLDYLTMCEREALIANPTVTCVARHDGYLCDPKSTGPVLLTTEGLVHLLRNDAVAVLMCSAVLAKVRMEVVVKQR